MRRAASLALGFVLALSAIAFAAPAANQTVPCSVLVAATSTSGSGTTFKWASGTRSCAAADLIITRATFVSWIANTGSCVGGTDYVMTYGNMIACNNNPGYTPTQQTQTANFSGNSAFDDIHGACHTTSGVLSYPTGSAVAPTSSATQIAWSGSGSNAAFTLTIKNPSGTTVATYSVPANSSSTYAYSNASASAGVYTVNASGLASFTCPAVGAGGTAAGIESWYQ